jgi:uncharacterized protein YjfI (DUF2170 family)
MSAKSTKYQQALRDRRRAQGLIKKEIWILPENSRYLLTVEKALRTKGARIDMTASIAVADATQRWTVQTLYNALQQDNLVKSGEAKLEMLAGADSVINVTMTEVGELPIQVSVAGEIIVAQVMLWERSLVKDPAAFHESVMVAEKMFELANISLDQLSNGTWVYVMYGSLRSTTALVDIIFELQTLAVNVIEAAEAFSDHLV